MGIRQVARYAFVAVRDEKECGLKWGGNGFGTTRKPPLENRPAKAHTRGVDTSSLHPIWVAREKHRGRRSGPLFQAVGSPGEESQELY
ncbi:hypothetical protein RB213_014630 [Colletotrichum asianum]